MNYDEVNKRISEKNFYKEIITNYHKSSGVKLNSSQKKEITKNIKKSEKFNEILNYIIFGILYNKKETISKIKKYGKLRYSKYINSRNIPKQISDIILGNSEKLTLTKDEKRYFSSISNLSPIYNIIDNLYDNIIDEIKCFIEQRGSKSIVKSLIVYLEFLFLIDYQGNIKSSPNNFSYYTKEKIGEAISYIIFIYKDQFGFNKLDSGFIDDDYILSGRIKKIILFACKIKLLKEFEILIDCFSYNCKKNDNEIKISHSNSKFSKSIDIGYVNYQIQRQHFFNKFPDSDGYLTLEDFSDLILEKIKPKMFISNDTYNVPRYSFNIPKILTDKILNYKELFKDERMYLLYSCKEHLLEYDNLESIMISDNLSIYDFFILRRIFVIFYFFTKKCLIPKLESEEKKVLNSLVQVFTKDKLWEIFKNVIEKKKFNEFIDKFIWDPQKSNIFDIQYHPIVKIKSSYLFPSSIFANSNCIRNLFASEYKKNNDKVFNDGVYDKLVKMLKETFKNQNFEVFTSIVHNYKNGGDIDFLAHKNNFLFIAECKKFTFPGNIYEERRIFNGLNKAEKQLDLIMDALDDRNQLEYISDKIDIDIDKFDTIRTSIITNTRLFYGMTLNNHPIRNIYELSHFMEDGTVENINESVSLWNNNNFTVEDLENFLEEDFYIFKQRYSNLDKIKNSLDFPDISFIFNKYYTKVRYKENN